MDMLLGPSWRTSLFAFGAAFLTYFTQVGVALPSSGKEWLAACASALMFAWGRVSADHHVTTTP